MLAAGLFHLVEQQLAVICKDSIFEARPLSKVTIGKLHGWYRSATGISFDSLPSWRKMDELHEVANVVKHGEDEGESVLRERRPELFRNPIIASIFEELLATEFFRYEKRNVGTPLSGDDFFVTEPILREYADAAVSFFEELQLAFEKIYQRHEQERNDASSS